jgi:Ca2+-binding EF-hand superfamily protein
MNRVLFSSLAILAFSLCGLAGAQDAKDDKKPDTKTVKGHQRRSSDVVYILIETSGFDENSIAELQRLYDVLRKLDKNKDGKIDPDALKAARLQIVEDRVDHIMSELDTDKDGKISREEAKGRILEHFDRLDLNKDGFISREELRQAILAAPKASATEKPK